MNEYEIKKLIHEAKELRDIKDEYKKTQQLLQERRCEELQKHISTVIGKHPTEALIHNLANPHMPDTIEQNAINCMGFLENLFKVKLGVDIADAGKYLTE